ncbi:MAG: DNA polymerase III subunit delta' [Candidatus Magnetobacterium sp. LHC-1]|nr:DNA polymerase III subunit delta' [Nitrospirota bacterium]
MSLGAILGHDRAIRVLRGMVRLDRIASAYLFSGPAQTGKRLTAVSFAKAIHCMDDTPGRDDACNRCLSCHKVDALTHPDMRVIAAEEGMIKIEKIRELEDFLSLTPIEWRSKVLIVDDADKLNPAAANAFLKTLEEPPAGSVIILLSAFEESLLDTIRSRCVLINFTPLSLKAARAVVSSMGRDIAEAHLRLSMGSIGPMLSDEVIGRRNRDMATFKALLTGEKVTQWKEKEEMTQWFESALVFIRDMMTLKVEPDSAVLINSDKRQELRDLGKNVASGTLVELYERILGLMNYFIFNINKSIVINYVQAMLENVLAKRPPDAGTGRGTGG